MFINARELNNGQHIESDVCIIGAVAANITIAREYIGTSANVVLLESGGLEFDKKTQSLYDVKNIGLPSFGLNVNRLRYFGGTTRMTDNPKTGVVDENCKLNYVSNLYIAGSSLFPTIGYANPTLTIVTLALRLADHTRSLVKG